MELLSGYKTYLIVILGIMVYGAEAVGLLQDGTANKLEGLLAILGLGALRSGIKSQFGN